MEDVFSGLVNAPSNRFHFRGTLDNVPLPLVHKEYLVCVLDPADVLYPRQPRRHQFRVGKEASEEQKEQDAGLAHSDGDCEVGGQTGYEVT